MTRITVINPNTSLALTERIGAAAAAVAPAGVVVTAVRPSAGVPSVESHAEEVFAALGVLEQVQAHAHVTDAFVIACFGDTGVDAARELSPVPVIGMTEEALHTACLIGHRFVVITMPERTVAQSERVVRALGLGHRCTVLAVDVPVADLEHGSLPLLEAFAHAAQRAREVHGAEVIVLGCAGLADLVAPLAAVTGLPVIDGVAAAVGAAASLIAQGLGTSRVSTFGPVPGLPDPGAALRGLASSGAARPAR